MDTPGSKPDQCVLYGATSASDGFSATISTSATIEASDATRVERAVLAEFKVLLGNLFLVLWSLRRSAALICQAVHFQRMTRMLCRLCRSPRSRHESRRLPLMPLMPRPRAQGTTCIW